VPHHELDASVSMHEDASPCVTVVLPCFNEEEHVVAEVERICAALDASPYSYELMAIDDCSTDRTLELLREAETRLPGLQVVGFPRNGGSGTARRIGTQNARGEIVVWTDADMSYPNELIPGLVERLITDPTVDQVVGARTSDPTSADDGHMRPPLRANVQVSGLRGCPDRVFV
jgi:polyisoprenyl-phosphate glycosyltransferase